ncbi:MAG: GNAT family N-acetyltransferase [Phycisphaerales bacterium JB040]
MGHAILDPVGLGLSPVGMGDQGVFRGAFARLREPISDSSFVTSFCWAEALELGWCVRSGHLCLFSLADGDLTLMHPPLAVEGESESGLGECVSWCFELMDEVNTSLGVSEQSRIEYVSDEMLERIRAAGDGGGSELSVAPMNGDYVYPRLAMVELAGGALKNKRKARSGFLRENPELEVRAIEEGDVGECLELLGKWADEGDRTHEGEANDQLVGTDVLRRRDRLSTERALSSYRELGMESMLVRSAGRLVGFTLGEWLTDTMGVVYVEKTDPEVDGTAQFIYSEFCRVNFGAAEEINAGDDWGIPSLRYTKTAYRPSRMLSKCVLTRAGHTPSVVVSMEAVRAMDARGVEVATPVKPEPAGLRVRVGEVRDLDAMLRIEGGAFSHKGERFERRQAKGLLKNPRGRVLVAEIDGEDGPEVVGWAVALVRRHRRTRSGRVYNVVVDPAQLGRGIGRRLFEGLLAWLADEGIERVFLEVRADNTAAIRLYESAGFTSIAHLRDYYGEGVDGVRMRRVREGNQSRV